MMCEVSFSIKMLVAIFTVIAVVLIIEVLNG